MIVCEINETNYIVLVFLLKVMPTLACKDYGFECEFVSKGDNIAKVIEEYSKHSTDEHGIEYSKEALMQFIIRKG
jgi:predicted small metal-binding protein